MIEKELSEIIDALTRETGESMLPYQELEILGFTPLGESRSDRIATPSGYNIRFDEVEEDDDSDIFDDDDNGDEGYVDEEYEFDEDDEEYTLLTKVLRFNNSRKKYFA